MTIDTSPEALAAIKEKMADKNYGKSSPTYIIMALIDALEEARAIIAALDLDDPNIPSGVGPPPETDGPVRVITGEDHYDATKHVIGEHARDWIERNRS